MGWTASASSGGPWAVVSIEQAGIFPSLGLHLCGIGRSLDLFDWVRWRISYRTGIYVIPYDMNDAKFNPIVFYLIDTRSILDMSSKHDADDL